MLESDQPEDTHEDPRRPAGKGRPTPKRSEVERRRREPVATDRKTAVAQERERKRAASRRQMEAQKRGEEWALNPRDRGAVKALARDYVDSRRLIVSEYILFAVFVLIMAAFLLGAAKNSGIIFIIEISIIVLIAAEASVHGAIVRTMAKKRFPGESTRGITWYIAKRSIRIRSSRIPPARVSRGQAI